MNINRIAPIRYCLLVILLVSSIVSALDMDKIKQEMAMSALTGAGGRGAGASTYSYQAMDQVDNSIDPNHYYIGGGDAFTVSVVNMPSVRYEATVNQQGDLYIPELGIVRIGRQTLTSAQDTIRQFVQKKLRQPGEIYVALAKVKMVTVSVNGSIANPGTYILTGAFRLLDAIRAANSDALPSLNDCNLREVLVANRDSLTYVDLYQYLLKNDVKGNPYIYPGDNITINLTTRRALMSGPTRSIVGGFVPIRETESVRDFISLFRFDESVDTSVVTIQNTGDDNKRFTRTIPWEQASDILLKDRDVVSVSSKKNYAPIYMAGVTGEASRPGGYPIIQGITTVADLIEAAGGPTQFANVNRTVVIRQSKIIDGTFKALNGNPPAAGSAISVRPELYSGYSKMTLTNDYAVLEVHNKAKDITLLPDDQIFIPKKDNFVYVSGNVKNPGAYSYNPNHNADYYVSAAGGYAARADRINMSIIRYYQGASQIKDASRVEEGDVIVVPDSQQARMLVGVILPILGAIVSSLSLGLALYSTLRR